MTRSALTLARAALERFYVHSGAEQWGLSHDEFAEAVEAGAVRAFAGVRPSAKELERYLATLHVQDLALARACALGNAAAWDHFVLEHRPVLYRAADAIDPTGGARELADSLYADLFGLPEPGAERRSLFRYFHGRSSLATWLRSVLAQRHVDALRLRRRLDPMPAEDGPAAAVTGPPPDPERPHLVRLIIAALRAAIDGLPASDRFRLRSYYAAELTLAEIGRITGEHEATVSRQLSRTRRAVKESIVQHLHERARLSDDQVARALELVLEDPGGLDLRQMFDIGGDRKEVPADRSQ